MPDIYNCTPRQTRAFINDVLEGGMVPNVISSPGMGKSSIIKGVGDDWNLDLIDHRLSTAAPEDLSGLPQFITKSNGEQVATFTPFDLFPTEHDVVPNGKDGWLLFFDEFNSGQKEVQAACYKITLDRKVGQRRLHERVAMVLAGNLMTDRAIVNELSTAMQSRVITIQMELNHRQWLEDVAYKNNYDERIIGYLNFERDHLMDFRPDHKEKTFCCPRTWEFMNNHLRVNPNVDDSRTPLYAGTITSGVALAFVKFSQHYKQMITIDGVLADPTGAPIPENREALFALISHLTGRITDKTFGDICKYIDRFSDTVFQIMFYRAAQVKHPKLREHPDFAKALSRLARHLKDD